MVVDHRAIPAHDLWAVSKNKFPGPSVTASVGSRKWKKRVGRAPRKSPKELEHTTRDRYEARSHFPSIFPLKFPSICHPLDLIGGIGVSTYEYSSPSRNSSPATTVGKRERCSVPAHAGSRQITDGAGENLD